MTKPAQAPGRRVVVLTLCGLFVFALVVFRIAPRGQLYDSQYASLVAHQLVTRASPALDGYVPQLGGRDGEGRLHDYRLVETNGRVHSFYPLGTPALAAPWVGLAAAFGWGPVDASGRFDRARDRSLQRWAAAGLMALAGVAFFLTAYTMLPLRPSLWVAGAALFASPVFSTTSRSLWSQTGAVLAVALIVLTLVRMETQRTSPRPFWLATLLALAWFCRPTTALVAVAVAIWFAARYRSAAPKLAAAGILWISVFVGLSIALYGSALPPYFAPSSHSFSLMPEALLGNLVSPARGLLIYCPTAAAVLFAAWQRRSTLPHRSLAWLAIGVIGAHWLVVSSHAPWWGGYGYGARLMAETVPWFVLLASLAWSGVESSSSTSTWLGRAAVASVVVGTLLNGIGATSRGAADWNHLQDRPDFERRLWRFDDPPFLRAFIRDPDAAASADDQASGAGAGAQALAGR